MWGLTITSVIWVPGETDTYCFRGVSGAGILVSVTGQPGYYFNAVADVYDPTGTRIGGITNNQTPLLNLAGGTGPYKILVHADDYNHLGTYGLTLSFVIVPPEYSRWGFGMTNGGAAFNLWGPIGIPPIFIQYATNLSDSISWLPLTNFNLPYSPYFFVDWSATNSPQRFYRVSR
jgi:hypothetical protein